MIHLQVLGLNVFALGTSDEFKQWADIAHLSNSLDKNDFLPKTYFVNEEKYSRKSARSSTPLLSRRKSKSKDERDLSYTPPSQTKRFRRENIDLSSSSEEKKNNMEFDEDHGEQCTLPVNLSKCTWIVCVVVSTC